MKNTERFMMPISFVFAAIGAIAGLILCYNWTSIWTEGLLLLARVGIILVGIIVGASVGLILILIVFLSIELLKLEK